LNKFNPIVFAKFFSSVNLNTIQKKNWVPEIYLKVPKITVSSIDFKIDNKIQKFLRIEFYCKGGGLILE